MTLYGLDVSHYQGALNLDSANVFTRQGFTFIAVKATQGAGFKDPHYHTFRDQAQSEGALFAAYHFLEHGDVLGQYRNFTEQVSDKSIPIMLDVEAGGATLADARAFRNLAHADGRQCRLLYLPHWYWQTIGSPRLDGQGWVLVSSAYPSSAHQYADNLYDGRGGSGWNAYGGVKPTIWQFGSSGKVDGFSGNVDMDAFEGRRNALAVYFKDYRPALVPPVPVPPKKPPKDIVLTLPPGQRVKDLSKITSAKGKRALAQFCKNQGLLITQIGEIVRRLNVLRARGELGDTGRAVYYEALGWKALFARFWPPRKK